MKNCILPRPETIEWCLIAILCGILPGLVLCHLPTSYACFSSQAQSSNLIDCLPGPCSSCHREVAPDCPFFVILFHFLFTQVTLISPADLSSIISSERSLLNPLCDQSGLPPWYLAIFCWLCFPRIVQALWLAGWHGTLFFPLICVSGTFLVNSQPHMVFLLLLGMSFPGSCVFGFTLFSPHSCNGS